MVKIISGNKKKKKNTSVSPPGTTKIMQTGLSEIKNNGQTRKQWDIAEWWVNVRMGEWMERWKRERLTQQVGLHLDYRPAICHYGIIIRQRDGENEEKLCTGCSVYTVCIYLQCYKLPQCEREWCFWCPAMISLSFSALQCPASDDYPCSTDRD